MQLAIETPCDADMTVRVVELRLLAAGIFGPTQTARWLVLQNKCQQFLALFDDRFSHETHPYSIIILPVVV